MQIRDRPTPRAHLDTMSQTSAPWAHIFNLSVQCSPYLVHGWDRHDVKCMCQGSVVGNCAWCYHDVGLVGWQVGVASQISQLVSCDFGWSCLQWIPPRWSHRCCPQLAGRRKNHLARHNCHNCPEHTYLISSSFHLLSIFLPSSSFLNILGMRSWRLSPVCLIGCWSLNGTTHISILVVIFRSDASLSFSPSSFFASFFRSLVRSFFLSLVRWFVLSFCLSFFLSLPVYVFPFFRLSFCLSVFFSLSFILSIYSIGRALTCALGFSLACALDLLWAKTWSITDQYCVAGALLCMWGRSGSESGGLSLTCIGPFAKTGTSCLVYLLPCLHVAGVTLSSFFFSSFFLLHYFCMAIWVQVIVAERQYPVPLSFVRVSERPHSGAHVKGR